MLITGPEGFKPLTNKTTHRVRPAGAPRAQASDASFDCCAISAPAAQPSEGSFRAAVAALSQQVRTHNTTGKIQELRRQVSTGEYSVDARETAARMLLLSGEDE